MIGTCFVVSLLSRYAKIHIPIIASVSEHQPTTWTSFFFDLHILLCMFPAGVWFLMKDLRDERLFGINLFILLYIFRRDLPIKKLML